MTNSMRTSIPCFSILGGEIRKVRLSDKAAVQKFHDVESCSDDTVIFAQAVCFRYRYISFAQCIYNAKLAIDLVGSLGEELPGWLLPHNKALAGRISELVRRVGLAEAKLCLVSIHVPMWFVGASPALTRAGF